MSAITNLEPRIVWEQFDAITRVPRPSKKEGRIIEFLVDFARKHNLEYKKDAIGNVVMRKPATPGFENRPTVILQSHMDMVCEKNSDVEFDFDNDPIRTHIDGGWVRAEDMTYGDLRAEYAPYENFDAFKNRRIYSCNTGLVPYYEEFPLHPDRKSTRLNSSHRHTSRMPSSA